MYMYICMERPTFGPDDVFLCLPRHTDMSAVSHGRHACHVTLQRSLLRETDMSAVRNSRHCCCVTQQTCLLCDTADMLAV